MTATSCLDLRLLRRADADEQVVDSVEVVLVPGAESGAEQ